MADVAVNAPSLARRMKLSIKRRVQSLRKGQDAIVVASFGRAGSTLIYTAVTEAMASAQYGRCTRLTRRLSQDDDFDLPPTKFRSGVVYKTHDYPTFLDSPGGIRGIFLFGSALDAALSVHAQKDLRGEDWVQRHFDHLRRPYRYDDIFKEDVLGFREQCISWMGCDKVPILCLRYEDLWDNVDQISKFCGVEVTLPERRARKSKDVPSENMLATQQVYGPIDAALARLPGAFIAAPKYADMMR